MNKALYKKKRKACPPASKTSRILPLKELTGLIQITEDGRIRLVKKVEAKSLELSEEVALDFGMERLFTTYLEESFIQKSRNTQRRLTNFKKSTKTEDKAYAEQEMPEAKSQVR